jgi:Leucine-rich repeat (LRR) protein
MFIISNHLLFPDTLRALYLGDNDFENLPPEIGKLKNLQIVSQNTGINDI